MKQITNYQRASQYLVKIFKSVNEDYFNSELELPTISIQSTARAFGHVSVQKVWHNNESSTHELNISADYLNRPIENVVATLVHECVHLFALQNDIKDTSNNGVYHNKRFKELAESCGLIIERHPTYGWTITSPSEETLNFCINHSFEDIQLCRQSEFAFVGISGGKSGNGSPISLPKKPSSTRKYICPCCGNSFRATKALRVMCIDCNVQFVTAE